MVAAGRYVTAMAAVIVISHLSAKIARFLEIVGRAIIDASR